MKLPAEAVSRFSADLFLIHAAGDEAQLAEALGHAGAAGRHPAWMAVLVREHAGVRCSQLQAGRATGGGNTGRLTPRERQVLERLAQGETDAAAACALGIATKTVSKHVESILRKLGVETRTAAALRFRAPTSIG